MAKFGIDATGMSKVNEQSVFRSNVQEGVADKSGAMRTQALTGLIGDIGEAGVGAMRGYAISELEKEQEKNISDYMSSKEAPFVAAEAEYNASKLRKSADAVWDSFNATIEEVNPIEKKFQEQLKTYKGAMEQGIMSPDELSTRILKTTREAINKNPGMYAELQQHANKVLEMSGISSIVEADKKAAEATQKAKDKQTEYLLSLAKENNIPVKWDQFGKPNLVEITPLIQQVQQEKAIVAGADRATSFDEAQFRTYGTTYMIGKYNQANDQAIKIINDDSQPYDKKIATVKMLFNSVREGIGADPRINRIIDKSPVQSSLKFMNDQIENTIKTLEGFSSKEDAKKYLENSTNMLRNSQYQEVSKYVNPVASETLSKLLTGPWSSRIIESNPELMNRTVNLMSNLVQGIAASPSTDYTLKGDRGQPLAVGAIGQLIQDTGKGNLASSESLQKAVDVLYKDSKNPEKFKTTTDKFNFYHEYMKELGKPENREGLKKVDDLTRMKITENLDEYLTLTLTDMQRTVSKWEKQGAKIQWDVLPDGRLTLQTNNPDAMQDLTSRYVNRVNHSIRAMSNLVDTNDQGAAGIIFPRYKDFFMPPSTLRKGEVSGTIKGIRMDVTPEKQAEMTAIKQAERGANLQADIAELEQALKTAKGTARGILLREYKDLTGKDYGTK